MENSVNCLIETSAREQKYKLKWIVENVTKVVWGAEVRSADFHVEDESDAWYVTFTKYSCFFYLKLVRKLKGKAFHIASDVKILDCNGKVCYENTEGMYKEGNYEEATLLFKIEERDILEKLYSIPKDTWYFIFIIKTYSTVKYSCSEGPSQQVCEEKTKNSFCANFWKIFDHKIGTDVTLQVQDDKIEAHKLVLSAQSPVFSRMFEVPMAESEQNTVVIEDISKEAMTKLVHFMYSKADIEYSFETALELYYAADKYEVLELREICGKILLHLLTEDNAGVLLELSDKHKDVNLKTDVMVFINSNVKACMKKDWWHEFMCKQNHLVKELVNFIK